ncbi:MAG: flagellin [Pseudobdellovibrionaceae bacterium]
MVNRVATFAYTNTILESNMRLQSQYSDINTQISSGLKSQDYKGIARDSQYLLAVESSTDRLMAYNSNSNTVLATVNTMYSTMTELLNVANSMLTTVTAALGGDQVPSAVTAAAAQNALDNVEGFLNLSIAGRYVFAGTDVSRPPVDLTDPGWTAQTSPSVANTSYYQGNTALVDVQISETQTISYGVLASNPAFEGLLRAFNLVFNNPGSATELREASGLIQQAVDDIANVQSILATKSNTIERQIDKNEQDKVYLEQLSSSIKEVDIPTASVQLTEAQTQLEAAYSASVRVLNLSLVNYLN